MELQELNKWLKDLPALRSGKNAGIQVIKEINGEGYQGEEGLSFEVYELSQGVYVKLRITTDSYGYNPSVSGIEFVKPIKKTVTDFETI